MFLPADHFHLDATPASLFSMSTSNDAEIWSSQISRWNEQAAVLANRIETKRIMFTTGAIGEQQFATELELLEADRLVYVHVIEEAKARLQAHRGK
jgi:hypothetical protein